MACWRGGGEVVERGWPVGAFRDQGGVVQAAIELAKILGTSLAFLDATVVKLSPPSIGADLNASLADLQWTIKLVTPLARRAQAYLDVALADIQRRAPIVQHIHARRLFPAH